MTLSKLTSFLVCFTVFQSKTATWGISPHITCLCLSSASAFLQTRAQMLSLDVTLYVVAWSPGAGSVLVHSLYPSFASLTPLFRQRGFNFENRERYWERITVNCLASWRVCVFCLLTHCWCIRCFTSLFLLLFFVSIGYQILKMRNLCIKICISRWNWRWSYSNTVSMSLQCLWLFKLLISFQRKQFYHRLSPPLVRSYISDPYSYICMATLSLWKTKVNKKRFKS